MAALPLKRVGGHRLTYCVLAVGVAGFALLQSLVIPVLPAIQEAVGATQMATSWVLTAYLLSAAVCTPVLGRLGDIHGKKKVLVGVLLALTAGCALAAATTSLAVLVVARVVQGAGGGVIPLSISIVRDEFPEAKVPGAIGVVAGLASAGLGAGIVLAGPIVEFLGYHWLFWLPMIMNLVAAVGAWLAIPESAPQPNDRINWSAAALLTVWLVALLVGVTRAPTWGWSSALTLSLLVLALVFAVLWMTLEVRSANPLIDMSMMRIRGVWSTNLVALLIGLAMYAGFAFVPAFLQTPVDAGYGFGVTTTQSGFLMLPQAASSFVLGLSAGWMTRRVDAKFLLFSGAATAAAGFLLLVLTRAHVDSIYVVTMVLGIGFGLSFSAMSNLMIAFVRAEQSGVASGMNANVRTIGGALGSATMASLLVGHPGLHGLPDERGYVIGFLVLSGAATLAAVTCLFVPRLNVKPPRTARSLLNTAEPSSVPYGVSCGWDRPLAPGPAPGLCASRGMDARRAGIPVSHD